MPKTIACPVCDSEKLDSLLLRGEKNKSRKIRVCHNCTHAFASENAPNQGLASGNYGMVNGLPPHFERDAALAKYLIYSGLIKAGDRVLDYGAGWGGLAIQLSLLNVRYELDVSISVYEPYSRMREYIEAKSNGNIDIREKLDGDTKYDLLIAKEVIEHVEDPSGLVTTMRNRLTKYGRLFLTTPGHPYSDPRKMQSYFNYYVQGHIQFFNKMSMTTLLDRAGYHAHNFTYIDDFYPENAKESNLKVKMDRTLKAINNRYKREPGHLQVISVV